MKKAIIMILLCNLLLSYFAGCAFMDRFIGSTQTENPTETPTEPIDPEAYQKALIGALVEYLAKPSIGEVNPHMFPFQTELGIIRESAQSADGFQSQAYLAKVDPERFYYMCGYYNETHPHEMSRYCCVRSYTWVKFESADAIQESYNDEKLIVAFQVNGTKACRNVMPVENTVPLFTYFQEYTPEFSDGYNIAAPLFADKFYVATTRSVKRDYMFLAENDDNHHTKTRACVVLDGVCYLTDKQYVEYPDGTREDYAMTAGRYYEALAGIMITDKYSETDSKGNIVHYRLFKLDDVVDILLNWEAA